MRRSQLGQAQASAATGWQMREWVGALGDSRRGSRRWGRCS